MTPEQQKCLIDHGQMLNSLAKDIHKMNRKWWTDLETGRPIVRNVGELLMLATSELSEALEGNRKNLMDDHLPDRKMFEVELADCIIRILDMAHGLGCDIGGALVAKTLYNQTRIDHTNKARKAANGKKY